MGLWGGTELTSFKSVVNGWQQQTGGSMKFEATRDLSAVLRARVAGGNPPDIAILPNPALLRTFAGQNKLQPLDNVLDMNQLKQQYASTWLDQATVGGKTYGVFVKAATKSTVWYNPKTFSAKGYQIPTTWDDLVTLTNKMRADGTAPWSIGLESGGASGWRRGSTGSSKLRVDRVRSRGLRQVGDPRDPLDRPDGQVRVPEVRQMA